MPCGARMTSRSVAVGIFGRDFEGLGVALGVGVAENVDRIVVAPVRGRNSSRACSVSAEGTASSPPLAMRASVASTAGPPALVTMHEPRPLRTGLLAENLRHIKQIRNRSDPQHAATPEGGIENVIASGQRTGVRGRSPGRGFGAAGLDHDHGLSESYFARSREK